MPAPSEPPAPLLSLRAARGTILVAGLGYMVDVFDLLLFAVVRVPSVRDLGVGIRELEVGALLQNAQLIGLMVGGLLWGALGDRRGRRAALYGSILLYSVATLANAGASTVAQYALWRLLAGVGLAGELGAAVTLVAELVRPERRGAGVVLMNVMGVGGACLAALVGQALPWRAAYVVGGVMGLLVLALRIRLRDSRLFDRARHEAVGRGSLRRLVNDAGRATRYLRAVLIGVPIWFTTGVLVIFAPEFARALGVAGEVTAGHTILAYYGAGLLGIPACGLLSERLRSRRGAIGIFLGLGVLSNAAYLLGVARTPGAFYALCATMGITASYWPVMTTMAAEQFGTDLRATVATSVPTFVRVSAVPLTLAFVALRPSLGTAWAAAVVGGATFAIAGLALRRQPETYGRDLDFLESP